MEDALFLVGRQRDGWTDGERGRRADMVRLFWPLLYESAYRFMARDIQFAQLYYLQQMYTIFKNSNVNFKKKIGC